MVSAVLTESAVCAITAGFYGAIAQSLKDARPEWLVLLFLMLVVPSVFQAIEFFVHWLHGTPHLLAAEIVSLVLAAVSSLFNLYAMRRGVLLVGGEGRPFGSDLRRLPKLFMAFLIALPRLNHWQHKQDSEKSETACTLAKSVMTTNSG